MSLFDLVNIEREATFRQSCNATNTSMGIVITRNTAIA